MPRRPQQGIPDIKQLLMRGPNTSATIARQLETAGLTAENARKRISRATYPVERLTEIQLPHREQILYLAHQKLEEGFVSRIAELLRKSNSSYGLALRSINARGGIVPLSLFNTVSGCPTRLKNQLGVEDILGKLLRHDLLRRATVPGVGEVVFAAGMNTNNSQVINEMKARLKAEHVALCGIRDWLRKLGLVSFDKVEIRGDDNRRHFGRFEWDLTAPSYVHPLASVGEGGAMTSGFVVADVMMLREATSASIDYFLKKFEILRSLPRVRPFMAFLVADRFELEAFRGYKSKGFVLTTLENIFGAEIAEALRCLVQVLSDAATAVKTDPERLDKMMDALAKIEGDALNVRSDLFEVAVGYCVREAEGSWVDLRQTITDPDSGKQAEIDVLSKKRELIHIIECKGNRDGHLLTRDEIETWFKERVPRIYGWLRSPGNPASSGQRIEFSVWTTGGFEAAAVDYLVELQANTGKYKVSWKERRELMDYLRSKKLSNMSKLITKHF